jgi:hypothetical protein
VRFDDARDILRHARREFTLRQAATDWRGDGFIRTVDRGCGKVGGAFLAGNFRKLAVDGIILRQSLDRRLLDNWGRSPVIDGALPLRVGFNS